MSRIASTVVVGAGIYGITAAIELVRRGVRVTVLDPGPLPHPDASSTDVSKAVRADYGRDEFYCALMQEALAGWAAWNAEWREPLYHEQGFLLLSSASLEPGSFECDSRDVLASRGFPIERWNRLNLPSRFPAWNPSRFVDGYFNPHGGWAESGKVVARLIEKARSLGVVIHDGVACKQFLECDGAVVGVHGTGGNDYRADVTLVAAGAWTPHLIPSLQDVMWVVGQTVLHFLPADPAPFRYPRFSVWAADISTRGWYGFPALADGRVKVANHGPGKRVHPGDPRTVDPTAEPSFREFLREALPTLADAPLAASRLCLYCDTWDGDFYIDHVPGRPGLAVATGGSGHGFKFAPVLGAITADVILGERNRYASRFAWRARGERRSEHARFLGPV